MSPFTRRQFLKASAGTWLSLGTPLLVQGCGGDDEKDRQAVPSARATVNAVLGDGPSDLYRMGRRAAELLGLHAGGGLSGKTVFIKPNFVVLGAGSPVDPETGEWTKAEIVVGIAEQCLEAGAGKVSIGDGAQGVDWDWRSLVFFQGNTVFEKTNLKDAVDSLRAGYPHQRIELLCLNEVNEWGHIPSSSRHEMMEPGLKIARSFYEADHVISVPVLKTHSLADMTCSMKNYVGVTPSLPPYGIYGQGLIRSELHKAYANAASGGIDRAGIEACFTDIVRWRRGAGKKDLAIVDCSIGIEGDGPTLVTGGLTMDVRKRVPAGSFFLLASDDLAAADAIAATVMGLDTAHLKQLRLAERLGIGETRSIRLVGDATLDRLRIRDLVKATQFDEWGVASTLPQSWAGSSRRKENQIANAVGAFGLAAGSIVLYRHLHDHDRQARIGSVRSPRTR
jgi:uncharacterized protein (DUF362 family)